MYEYTQLLLIQFLCVFVFYLQFILFDGLNHTFFMAQSWRTDGEHSGTVKMKEGA